MDKAHLQRLASQQYHELPLRAALRRTIVGSELPRWKCYDCSNKFDPSIPGLQWLNPAAFCNPSDPGCGGGPVSRNKFPGPNFKDVDLSVIKNIPITERFKLQLRADMFNMFNRTNFASGVGAVNTGCNED